MLKLKNENYPGLLITFCGLDGSGKTTVIRRLQDYLASRGCCSLLTKQPTEHVRQSPIFRAFMDDKGRCGYDYRSLSLLAASDRVQHSNKVILPALRQGQIILSDRYFYSCLANLRARGYKRDRWIYEIIRCIPRPDLSVFLDLDHNLAIRRVRQRPEEREKNIDCDFQKRLRAEYIRIAKACGGLIVPSHGEAEATFRKIKPAVDRLLVKKGLVRHEN